MADSVGDEWAKARALNTIGYAQLWVDPPGARGMLERSIKLGEAVGDDWAVADGWKMISIAWLVQDDHPALAAALDQLARFATRLGNTFFVAWCHAGLGLSALRCGHFDAAREHLQTSQQYCREVGDPATGGLVVAWLAELEALTGETTAARQDLEAFLAHASATGAGMGVPHAHLELAAIALGVGDAAGARKIVEARLSKPCLPLYIAWARVILGGACVALGETTEAKTVLEKAKKGATRLGNPWLAGMADHELGLLARSEGELAEAEDFQHSALATCQRAGLLPGIVDGLEALAALAVDHESPAEAARVFGAAAMLRSRIGLVRGIAQQCGYDADVTRTEELLGAEVFAAAWVKGAALDTGEAVAYASRARGKRKRPPSGWAGLTPTEEQVVALVAQGLTNPQVAERLFIARGTVKVHLTHVFTKLGVATRAELAAAATRRSVERSRR